MTKREKNIRAIAKAINRAHGISMKQCLELARIDTRAREAADEIEEIEFTDGTKWKRK
jgi:hypothetical protein